VADFNPYAPPINESGGPGSSGLPGTGEPLFTDGQVAAATFLGSTLAGFILIGLNDVRLGKQSQLNRTVWTGIALTVAVLALALVLPDGIPGLALTMGYVFGVRSLARSWQGEDVTARLATGTRKASNWAVVGISLGCFAGLVLLVAVLVLMFPALFL
jgi:hypothetical protein